MRSSRNVAVAAGVLMLLLITGPAWAALVTVTVTDSSGRPVDGATVSFGGEEATTGPDGTTVTVELPEGEHEVVIMYDGRRVVHRVSVREGSGVQNIPLALPRPGQPGRPGWPGGFLGFGAMFQGNQQHPVVVSQTIDDTFTIQKGSASAPIVSTSHETLDQSALNDLNTKLNKVVDDSRQMAWFNIPVGMGGSSLLASRRAAPGIAAGSGVQDEAGGGSPGWRFYPSLSVGVGRTDVTFDTLSLEDSAGNESSVGDGRMWGVGVSGILFPCASCGWYTSFAYTHMRSGDIDLTTTPTLQSRLDDGIRVVRNDVQYRYRGHVVQAAVGHAFERMAVWGGVRGAYRRTQVDGQTEVDASERFGILVEQAVTFQNRLEADSVEAVGGIDLRIPRTPLLLRLEGSTDGGDNHALSAGFGIAIR